MKNNIYFLLFNFVVITIVQRITWCPWWTFLVVSVLMGFVVSLKEIELKVFTVGFLSGFLNWLVASWFFHASSDQEFLEKVASIFFVNSVVLILAIGILGGLLNGLACYSGLSFFRKEEELKLD